MPTTEAYIVWSETFARRHNANRQLFIEVGMATCRWHRDNTPNASTIPELANADHYWLGRFFGFMVQSVGQPGFALEGIDRTLADAVGSGLALLSAGIGATPWIVICGAWELLKRGTRAVGIRPPGGGAPASAPNASQVTWAVAGWGHAMTLDLPFARDARPWFRMGEFPPIVIPPLPT